jgi:alpha-tubulin suppressor-like RCC1 family protein
MNRRWTGCVSLAAVLILVAVACTATPDIGGGETTTTLGGPTSTTTSTTLPGPPPPAPPKVDAVAVAREHVCELTELGGVRCWGRNAVGQLGDGTRNGSPVPVDVVGLPSRITAIALGIQFSCALTDGGKVLCWGENDAGQLGNRTTTFSAVPTFVVDATGAPIVGMTSISAGDIHACGVTASHGVRCWGGNVSTQLADGTTTNRPWSADVDLAGSGIGPVQEVSAGGTSTCVTSVPDGSTESGKVACWGLNNYGQLGVGQSTPGTTPFYVRPGYVYGCDTSPQGSLCNYGPLTGITHVAAGFQHTCAVTTDPYAVCWGDNAYGDVAAPPTGNRAPGLYPPEFPQVLGRPRTVSLGSTVAAVASGFEHSCALTTIGGIACWGANNYGQLGVPVNDGTTNPNPVGQLVTGLTGGADNLARPYPKVKSIAAGTNNTCAVLVSGAVRCWGQNDFGQLGNYSLAVAGTQRSATPVDVDQTPLNFAVTPNSVPVTGGQSSASVTVSWAVFEWSSVLTREVDLLVCRNSLYAPGFDQADACSQTSRAIVIPDSVGVGSITFGVFRGRNPDAGSTWGCFAPGDTPPAGVTKYTTCYVRAIGAQGTSKEAPFTFRAA